MGLNFSAPLRRQITATEMTVPTVCPATVAMAAPATSRRSTSTSSTFSEISTTLPAVNATLACFSRSSFFM